MPDDPHFPAPRPKGSPEPYREPERPAPAEPPRAMVKRAEPPPSSKPERAALTREEMRALITVTAAQRPAWRRSAWRSPVLVASAVVSHLLHAALGAYAYPIDVLLFIASLVWIARPLMRRDGFS